MPRRSRMPLHGRGRALESAAVSIAPSQVDASPALEPCPCEGCRFALRCDAEHLACEKRLRSAGASQLGIDSASAAATIVREVLAVTERPSHSTGPLYPTNRSERAVIREM